MATLASQLERTAKAIEELPRKVEMMMGKAIVASTGLQKQILNQISSMGLEIPAILRERMPKKAVAHDPNRIIVTPRSRPHSTRATPSTSRDRSRSPIVVASRRPSDGSVKPPHNPGNIRCVLCSSVVHLSRDCNVVMSLSTRLAIMQSYHDTRCHRCFRPLNDDHKKACEPEVCSKGCTDDVGRPIRHMQWFCPQNERLTP